MVTLAALGASASVQNFILNLIHRISNSKKNPPQQYRAPTFASSLPLNPRILVIKIDHIGDMLSAMRSFQELSRAWPHGKITLVCSPQNVELAEATEFFEHVIPFRMFPNRSHIARQPDSVTSEKFAQLKLPRVDIAIDLRHDEDTRFLLDHVESTYICGFSSRTVERRLDVEIPHMEFKSTNRAAPVSPSAEARVLILTHAVIDTFCNEAHPLNAVKSKYHTKRLPAGPYAVICPTAGSEIKQWPIENFVIVARTILEKGMPIVLVGDRSSQVDCRHIEHALKDRKNRIINLTGQVSLLELSQVLKRARLFIGNDSGPGHMAAILDIPTVIIFSGVANIQVWHPRGAHAVAIKADVSCSPCSLASKSHCSKNLRCLTEITPDDVIRTAFDLRAQLDDDKNRKTKPRNQSEKRRPRRTGKPSSARATTSRTN
jgi:ADP-heptose:LPS heptosyltransferase